MDSITKKIQAVIFDLDGTITKPVLDFDKIRAEIGITAGPVWETIITMPKDRRKQAEKILLKYELQAARSAELNEGAKEIFDILAQRDIKSAILTRNCRQGWEIVRDKFDLNIPFAFTRETGPMKPDPSAVIQITKTLRISAENSLVVGDYLFDIQAGREAGAKTALLVHNDNLPDYANLADYIIHNLLEIVDIIDNGKL
jgi:HAD superfamily hydrolase (TIGR01509 family)